jgi:hypothetical protein
VYGQPPPSGWHDSDSNALSVQTGYEGYLVPSEEPETHSLLSNLGTIGILSALLPPLGKVAFKLGFVAIHFIGLFLIGSLLTAGVCTFTPLCTISFLGLGGFSKESVRSFLTQDRLNQLSQFVMDAVEKYKNLQKTDSKKE